ncbi:MAG: transposase [Phormidesmis sp. CAN_BIN44]|nr:transposase [Phormidesmis sp. CAN_BIN44]
MCLIPQLRPGEWVIVDNATFHHGDRIAQLIEAARCKFSLLTTLLTEPQSD